MDPAGGNVFCYADLARELASDEAARTSIRSLPKEERRTLTMECGSNGPVEAWNSN
jgi:hypothetical protein